MGANQGITMITLKELCITKFDANRLDLAQSLDVSIYTINNMMSKGKKVVKLADGQWMTVSDYDIMFNLPDNLRKQAK